MSAYASPESAASSEGATAVAESTRHAMAVIVVLLAGITVGFAWVGDVYEAIATGLATVFEAAHLLTARIATARYVAIGALVGLGGLTIAFALEGVLIEALITGGVTLIEGARMVSSRSESDRPSHA